MTAHLTPEQLAEIEDIVAEYESLLNEGQIRANNYVLNRFLFLLKSSIQEVKLCREEANGKSEALGIELYANLHLNRRLKDKDAEIARLTVLVQNLRDGLEWVRQGDGMEVYERISITLKENPLVAHSPSET